MYFISRLTETARLLKNALTRSTTRLQGSAAEQQRKLILQSFKLFF